VHWYMHGAKYAIRSNTTVSVQCLNEFRLVYARKAGTSNIDDFFDASNLYMNREYLRY
jgi:hypothetical protein